MSDARKFRLIVLIMIAPLATGFLLAIWGIAHANFWAMGIGLFLTLLEPIVLRHLGVGK